MLSMNQIGRSLLLTGVLALTGCQASADEIAPAADLKPKLAKVFEAEITSIKPSPVKGLFEVVVEGREVYYTDATGRYLVRGDLLDLQTRTNLTRERAAELSKTDFAKLPLADAIKEVRGKGERKLVIFSDPDCPYCMKLEHESLAGVDNVTIYTFLYPLPFHQDAARKSRLIWCAPDRAKAWQQFVFEQKLPAGQDAQCANPIERNIALANKLGINGTPGLIFENGRMVGGAIPKDQLLKMLDSASKEAAAQRK